MSAGPVRVDVRGELGALSWDSDLPGGEEFRRALAATADEALAGGVVRLQAEILATDHASRRALHSSGFRQEGRLRAAARDGGGELVDVLIYSRLNTDVVDGAIGFSAVMDSVLPTKRVIAHVVFTDQEGRVLLAETTYKQDWELPGGVVDRLEPPRAGARREVLEEISLDREFGNPAITDWMPPSLAWSDAVEFFFDGGVLPPEVASALRATDSELVAVHWVPREKLKEHVSELSARRIELLLGGYRGMTENGYPVAAPGSSIASDPAAG